MKAELRDMLGKTAYEARHMTDILYNHSIWLPWDRLAEVLREEYRDEAEAVIVKFAEVFIPLIKAVLSSEDITRLLSEVGHQSEA